MQDFAHHSHQEKHFHAFSSGLAGQKVSRSVLAGVETQQSCEGHAASCLVALSLDVFGELGFTMVFSSVNPVSLSFPLW